MATEPTGTQRDQGLDPAPARRRRLSLRKLRGPRGILVLLFLGALGALLAQGATAAVHYSETRSFCSSCHLMEPEVRANLVSPHRDVTCGECHISPGVKGFVKAKYRGTQELIEVLAGDAPHPVPPAEREMLPPVGETCLACHVLTDLTRPGGDGMIVQRVHFDSDRSNTREDVSVALRPDGIGADGSPSGPGTLGGPHGHVANLVTFNSSGDDAETIETLRIDAVSVVLPNGTTRQYLSKAAIGPRATAAGTLARITSGEPSRTMDCLDCHNRVGHDLPTADHVVDGLLATGKLDPSVPFLKRDSVELLTADYGSQEAAEAAIDDYSRRLPVRYPLVRDRVARQLKAAYLKVAVPSVGVQARTYADNFGHQASPGCFRCHDGQHVQVVKGRLTERTIPSTCATCHSFPTLAAETTRYLLDGRPGTHQAVTWAYGHAGVAPGTNPTGTSCGACHRPEYCASCHQTGAVDVRHQDMLSSHPQQVSALGAQSCSACHQQVSFCVTCHTRPQSAARRSEGGSS